MIVANDVSDSSIGFNSESNAALLLWRVYSKMEQPEMANEYACSALKLGMKQAKSLCKESK